MQVEARAYGPDSSADDIAALKAQIMPLEADIVLYQEVPVMSVFQVGVYSERLSEIAETMQSYRLLVDLSRTGPPGAEIRQALQKMFRQQVKLRQMAAFTEKNFVITVAAKFVFRGFSKGIVTSVHQHRADAIGALHRDG